MKAPVPRAIACRGCLVVAAATLIAFALAGYVLDVAAFRLRWMTLFALLAIVLALSQRRFGWRAAVSGVVGLAIVLLTANQLLGFVAGRILFVGGSGLTPPLGPGFAGGLCCLGLALLVDAVLPPRLGRRAVIGILAAVAICLGAIGSLVGGTPVEMAVSSGWSQLVRMRPASGIVLILVGIAMMACLRSALPPIGDLRRSLQQEPEDGAGLAASVAVLVVVLGATALAWRIATDTDQANQDAAIERTVERVGVNLSLRLREYADLLNGARGLFSASSEVSRAEWRRFASAVDFERRYAGIRAFGFVKRVVDRDAAGLTDPDGRPVAIWPEGQRDQYFAVAFTLPDDPRNRRVLGFDLGSVPGRRPALEAARDEDVVRLTPRVDLIQEDDPDRRPGFVMVVPVYLGEAAPADVALRTDRLAGFAYVVFSAADLVDSARDGEVPMNLRLYDGDAPAPADLVYETAPFTPAGTITRAAVAMGGRSWTLEGQPSAALAGSAGGDRDRVLLVGVLTAIVLFAITWLLAGNRARALAMARTMTEEWRRSERTLKAVTDTAKDGIVTTDAQARILYMNPAAERGFRAPPGSLIGSSALELFAENERPLYERALRRGLHPMEPGLGDHPVEVAAHRRDGTEYPAEVTFSRWSSDEDVFITAIIRDISRRRLAEQELERRTQELQRSNAELEQFAYVASHDLQEPLRMVASYVQLLARRYRDQLDADADEFIGYAVDGATRMQRLIQDLLAYARIGRAGKEPVGTDAAQAARQAISQLTEVLREAGARIDIDLVCRVVVVPSQLVQLFQNLIGNAVKFRGAATPSITIDARREDAMWHFRVADNGIGIEPQHRERVFAIFQRLHTRREYPGTGIGLAICRKIVEGHGGTIWVESEPGHGAVFHFTLPGESDHG
jgi:PAS domain S-box-containing protein